MINEISKLALKKILNLKSIMLINLYVVFGAIIFANNNANSSYGYMFIKILTNKNFFLIFIFPAMMFLIVKTYNFYYSNNFFAIRMNSKKNIFKYNCFTSFIIILYYYINVVFCALIASNIIIHAPLKNNALGYNVPDLVIIIYYALKLLLYMFALSMLILILIYKIQNIKLVICIIIAIILYINLGSSVLSTRSVFDVNRYILEIGYTKDFLRDMRGCLLFNLLLYPSLAIILNEVGIGAKNVSEIEEK